MKKQLIATLVGGLILFIWQFLSWSALSVHANEFQYTPNQDKIMEALSQNLEDGGYFLPGVAPGATNEEKETAMKNSIGKPWATIHYHKAMQMNMGMNLTRGLAADLVAVFLLVWLLLKFAQLDMKTAVLSSLAVGSIAYLSIPYLNSIWFETSTLGYLVDLVVQWGLIGAWLGWWLPRK